MTCGQGLRFPAGAVFFLGGLGADRVSKAKIFFPLLPNFAEAMRLTQTGAEQIPHPPPKARKPRAFWGPGLRANSSQPQPAKTERAGDPGPSSGPFGGREQRQRILDKFRHFLLTLCFISAILRERAIGSRQLAASAIPELLYLENFFTAGAKAHFFNGNTAGINACFTP